MKKLTILFYSLIWGVLTACASPAPITPVFLAPTLGPAGRSYAAAEQATQAAGALATAQVYVIEATALAHATSAASDREATATAHILSLSMTESLGTATQSALYLHATQDSEYATASVQQATATQGAMYLAATEQYRQATATQAAHETQVASSAAQAQRRADNFQRVVAVFSVSAFLIALSIVVVGVMYGSMLLRQHRLTAEARAQAARDEFRIALLKERVYETGIGPVFFEPSNDAPIMLLPPAEIVPGVGTVIEHIAPGPNTVTINSRNGPRIVSKISNLELSERDRMIRFLHAAIRRNGPLSRKIPTHRDPIWQHINGNSADTWTKTVRLFGSCLTGNSKGTWVAEDCEYRNLLEIYLAVKNGKIAAVKPSVSRVPSVPSVPFSVPA